MPSYLWTGKDASGNELTDRVTAPSVEESKAILEGRGWHDLKVHNSGDIQDFVKQQIDSASDPDYRASLTPREDLTFIKGTAPGFWARWVNSFKESAKTILLLAGLFAWSVYRQRLWGIIVCGGLLFAIMFLYPVLHIWFSKTSDLFRKLHSARNWRRWDEVLGYLEDLKKAQLSRKMGIGAAEMARYRALAYAGKGRLGEAIEVFNKAAEAANMPGWLRFCHLSSIQVVAEKYEQALDCYRQALEQPGDKSVVYIDYAALLVQRFNQPAEARELLEKAEATPLPEQSKSHVSAIRGVIAYREGNFVEADQLLSEALTKWRQVPSHRTYIYEPSVLLAEGQLAAINAALGRKDKARAYFSKAGKYLEVIRMDDLLSDYRQRME